MRRIFLLLTLVGTMLAFTISVNAEPPETQCRALTTKNVQCKNKSVSGTTYCGIHDPTAPRCGAPTSKKKPCKNKVPKTGDKCSKHG